MLRFRTFGNFDPPLLVDIWRSRGGQSGLYDSISIDLLERYVFSRLYFDYKGLIIALENDRPVGFAHAGFGPGHDGSGLCTEMGTTCLVVVRPDCSETKVAAGLLEQSERYLVERGAKVIYGGAIQPLNAFYLGLYGGSELPGVLQSDEVARNIYNAAGYKEIDRTIVFQTDLRSFKPPVSRQLMQIRRRMTVQTTVDQPTRTWWEACTLGNFDLTRYELIPRRETVPVGHAVIRNMNPTSAVGTGTTVGLIELHVDKAHRRQGLVSFLLGEMFHQLGRQGTTHLEVQTMQHNTAGVGLYRKLGFREIDQGIVFRKQ